MNPPSRISDLKPWLESIGRRFNVWFVATMRDKRNRPRFVERWYAKATGRFWLPCPICGEMFGGHEWAGDLMDSIGHGRAVCANCADEAWERTDALFKAHHFLVRHSDGRVQGGL